MLLSGAPVFSHSVELPRNAAQFLTMPARVPFVRDMSVADGIPVWHQSTNSPPVRGSGNTELDLRDFIYFASSSLMRFCAFAIPGHIEIPYRDIDPLAAVAKVDISEPGDVIGSR